MAVQTKAAKLSSVALRISALIFFRLFPAHFPSIAFALFAIYVPSYISSYFAQPEIGVLEDEVDVTVKESTITSETPLLTEDGVAVAPEAEVVAEVVDIEEKLTVGEKVPSIANILLSGAPSARRPIASISTFLINAILIGLTADALFRARWYYPSDDLSFVRLGYVSPSEARFVIREPDQLQMPITFEYHIKDDEPTYDTKIWLTAGYVTSTDNSTDFTTTLTVPLDSAKQNIYEWRTSNNHTGAEAFKHFKKLWQEQQETIATNGDADALRYGLLRFPNLRRMVVSPAAHGKPGLPLYLTPTIRSLPRGLLYPIERGWPLTKMHSNFPEARDWDRSEKDRWRGYCLVSRIIAQHLRENPESKLADLAIDTNQLRTGISCRMFDDAENSEIKDLNTILSHPGFAGLDLSLHCGNQCNMNWCSFRSNHLRNTLSIATDIQHFSLFTNVVYVDDFDDSDDSDGEEGDHFIPLHSIFPVNDWHQLRHFGLSRFIVKKDDVIKFLRALPPTLESVELSFFIFMPDSGDYHSLVHDMHEKLGWRERDAENQPKIVVRVDVRFAKVHGAVMMDVSREVTSFMYQNGENPFEQDEGCVEDPYIPQSDTPQGNGRLLDAFDPRFEKLMSAGL